MRPNRQSNEEVIDPTTCPRRLSVMHLLTRRSTQSDELLDIRACSELNRSVFDTGRRSRTMPTDSHRPADAERWASLIEAVAARQDRSAFATLFGHFAPLIKTFMRRSGVSDPNADELAQETLLMVWRKATQFDPSTVGAAAWIFTIARNLRIDALRHGRRAGANEVSDVDTEFQVDEAPGPDSRAASAQAETRVRAMLAELSDEQRRVLELSFYEEKPHVEIALLLKIPLGTVKSRSRLAMNRLRNLLSEFS
jgi:RNA polymerase sigma-70 factor, ECF subfamily